jgi:hypothetical protein
MPADPSPHDISGPPIPPRLRLLNAATLDNLATTLEDCAQVLESGQTTLRGMNALLILRTLAELLHEAAARER